MASTPRPGTLGQRIRTVRQQRGLTQDELARALSAQVGTPISRSTLGNYETGRRTLSAELLVSIAAICAVPLTAFAVDAVDDAPARLPAPPVLDVPLDGTHAAAIAMITQTLHDRPDVIPFVLEMLAAFVDDGAESP